jgi:hypothetical protein
MNAFVKTPVRANEKSQPTIGQPAVVLRFTEAVRVEIGTGAIAPKVAIVRRKALAPVNVEVGTGAIAPKVAIVRRKASAPVNVEVGTGAIAPKVAIVRGKASLPR